MCRGTSSTLLSSRTDAPAPFAGDVLSRLSFTSKPSQGDVLPARADSFDTSFFDTLDNFTVKLEPQVKLPKFDSPFTAPPTALVKSEPSYFDDDEVVDVDEPQQDQLWLSDAPVKQQSNKRPLDDLWLSEGSSDEADVAPESPRADEGYTPYNGDLMLGDSWEMDLEKIFDDNKQMFGFDKQTTDLFDQQINMWAPVSASSKVNKSNDIPPRLSTAAPPAIPGPVAPVPIERSPKEVAGTTNQPAARVGKDGEVVIRSRFKGVRWYKRTNKWVVQIRVNGQRKHIGYFTDEEEAGKAYALAMEDSKAGFGGVTVAGRCKKARKLG